jgi:hypothetical protein
LKSIFILAKFPTISFQFDYGLVKNGVNLSLENNLIKLFYNNILIQPDDHFEKVESKSFAGDIYYKFNSGKNISGKPIDFKYQKTLGYYGGLTAEVFIGRPDQFLYYETPETHHSFFSIYIHNLSLNAVESTDNPIKLTPGLNTELKIKRIFKERLPYPYNDCIKDVSSSYKSVLVKYILTKTNSLYRQKDCFNLCLIQYLKNMCDLPIPLSYLWEIKWGNISLNCAKTAYSKFYEKNLDDICLKDCPNECDSIEFTIEVMTSKFPSQAYALELMNNSKIKSNYPPGYNITLDDLRESMVQFSVYYTDFYYTHISQIPKEELVDLVSTFGGLFGLFIGMSFLSFGELIEIIVEVLIILCEKSKVKNIN